MNNALMAKSLQAATTVLKMHRFSALLLIIVLAVFALGGCKSQNQELTQLKAIEAKFWGNRGLRPDIETATELDKAYKQYIYRHPDDTIVPQLMYDRARLNMLAFQNTAASLDLLQAMANGYPQHRRAPDALFQAAFTYDEAVKDKESARKLYREFISRYPEHPRAGQADTLIYYLDHDISELFDAGLNGASNMDSLPR